MVVSLFVFDGDVDVCVGGDVSMSDSGIDGNGVPAFVGKVSRKDMKLKEFIRLCCLLEGCIGDLTRERDSPRVNDEYFLFKRDLIKIKNNAIVEAYGGKCLKWKF